MPNTYCCCQALLAEFAPVALRSLYERDTRRSFCRPALWVAPYKLLHDQQAQQQQQQQQQQQHGGLEAFFSAAAVVQSLLFGQQAGTATDATTPLQVGQEHCSSQQNTQHSITSEVWAGALDRV